MFYFLLSYFAFRESEQGLRPGEPRDSELRLLPHRKL